MHCLFEEAAKTPKWNGKTLHYLDGTDSQTLAMSFGSQTKTEEHHLARPVSRSLENDPRTLQSSYDEGYVGRLESQE